MEVKMRCPPVRSRIICRELNWREIKNFHIVWNDDNSTRMLPGIPFDASTALHEPINFSSTQMEVIIIHISTDIAICSFFCNGTDCSCTIYIIFSEKLLCIVMGKSLVFPTEVQIDIRNFISIEAQESFKRDILSIFFE